MKKRFQSYYDYLHTRSSIGLLYRKLFLYPKISKPNWSNFDFDVELVTFCVTERIPLELT